jgi:hypothetical protein
MANDNEISIDEFLSKRKDFVKSNGVLMKAAKAPSSWNDEERSVVMTMSTDQEDRDRDVVVQAGLDISEFLKNPVAPFAHRSYDFSVGNWSDVKKDLPGDHRSTEGKLTLLPAGGDAQVDRVAFHMKNGGIKMCSIGFMPKRVRRREEDADGGWPGYEIVEATLLECSPCLIGANPGALAKAAQNDEEAKWAREYIEEICDTWVKHPETGLLVPYGEFVAAYKALTGEKTTVTIGAADLTPDAEKSLLAKFTEGMKYIFKTTTPEPEVPKIASAETKAAALARAQAYRERQAAAA